MSIRYFFAASTIAVALLASRARADVDFTSDIKPILESNCLKCHGAEEAKSGLRLDSHKALLNGSKKTENVVVAGKPDESILYKLVSAPKSAKERMPPDGEPMPKEKAELIKKWISEGAKWPDGLVLKTPESKGSPEDIGVAITDAEKAGVEKLKKQGVYADRLAQNTNWLRVDFSRSKEAVKEENLVLLKDMPNLTELNLGGTNISDKDLVHLKPLTNLTRLVLHNTKITDAGLENLKSMIKLYSLNLYADKEITDKGLEHLKGLTALRRLYLWDTKVTKEAAKAMVEDRPGLVINLGAADDYYKGKVDAPPKVEGSGSASGSASGSGSGSTSGSGSGSGSPKPPGSGSGSGSTSK
jgi:Leucine-rich repeat (LRR) protein